MLYSSVIDWHWIIHNCHQKIIQAGLGSIIIHYNNGVIIYLILFQKFHRKLEYNERKLEYNKREFPGWMHNTRESKMNACFFFPCNFTELCEWAKNKKKIFSSVRQVYLKPDRQQLFQWNSHHKLFDKQYKWSSGRRPGCEREKRALDRVMSVCSVA